MHEISTPFPPSQCLEKVLRNPDTQARRCVQPVTTCHSVLEEKVVPIHSNDFPRMLFLRRSDPWGPHLSCEAVRASFRIPLISCTRNTHCRAGRKRRVATSALHVPDTWIPSSLKCTGVVLLSNEARAMISENFRTSVIKAEKVYVPAAIPSCSALSKYFP